MDGLKSKKYLQQPRKRFDPLALIASSLALFAILVAVTGVDTSDYFFDPRSILIVAGGTAATLLFQFDFTSCLHAMTVILKSFLGTPDRRITKTARKLDDAIINGMRLSELEEGRELTGELLNDVVYMHHQGLLFEEIDAFITSRIKDEYLGRQVAVTLLNRAAVISPALGLFGTVMGLIGVLKTLNNPGQIGPAMSLALMTTAYGAGLASLIFTPLAGRLEHHNTIFIEAHDMLLSKVGVLINREDRHLDDPRIEREEVA